MSSWKCTLYTSPTEHRHFAEPTLNVLKTHTWLTAGQNHPTQSLYYNKVLTISPNLLNTVLKAKKNGGMDSEWLFISCLPLWLHDWLGGMAFCHCPPSQKMFNSSPGKDQNSKHDFYWMHIAFIPIIESKNFRLILC